MFRPFAFAALALAAFGCAKPEVEVARVDVPAPVAEPAAPRSGRLPVAPMPHLPREPFESDLTNNDLGLDSKVEAALPAIDRIDQKGIDSKVLQDPITGLPATGLPDESPPDPLGPATAFLGRTGATQSRLVREGGGTASSEAAVARGLAWLAKQQKKDGSWAFDAGNMKDDPAAATGLALLPFLGAGETHKKKDGKYKDAVTIGLQWLVKNLNAKGADAGKFLGARTPTGQALGTLALVEAYGQTRDPVLRAPAQFAINVTLQPPELGFRFPGGCRESRA